MCSLVACTFCCSYHFSAVDTYRCVLLTSLFYSYFVIFGIVEQLICCTYSAYRSSVPGHT